MNSLNSAPAIETHLETQTVLYPTLQQLVRLLPWDHKRVVDYFQQEAKHNPFLVETSAFQKKEVLLEDVLPQWYNTQTQGLSLNEHLLGQITVSIPASQREAVIYLTQWLSNGYLQETPEAWASGSMWSAKELEAVIPILQSLDPPGIGARSLRECLLLQLKDQPESLAFLLVQDYLEELGNCIGSSQQVRDNCELLLQKLHQRQQVSVDTGTEAINDAIQKIQELEPRPARNFGSNYTPIVTPDLKVKPIAKEGWQVSLVSEVEQRFCLDSEAIELLKTSPNRSPDTQKLEGLLQKAKSLVTALHLWQENLLKVSQFLVDRQQAFLFSRDRLDLVPTPQQLVAQSVGLSNSTVSRIVRGRYILVDDEKSRIMPLYLLCVPARVGGRTPEQVKLLLLQLIEEESSTNPYSDQQLAQLLKIRFGLPITRRTVTKYRKIAGISSSHRRKL